MIKLIQNGKHKGKYQVRIQPTDPATGKRVSWPVQYADTKKEAKLIESKLWLKSDGGEDLSKGNNNFADTFEKYIKHRNEMGVWSAVTYRDWKYSSRVFHEYFGNLKIKQITIESVTRFAHKFVEEHNATVSDTSMIARRLSHLNYFFKAVTHRPLLPKNALSTVIFRKSEFSVREQRYLFTDDDLEKIKSRVKNDLKQLSVDRCATRMAIWIDAETGMRTQEIQALRFDNLVKEGDYFTFKIDSSWSDYSKDFGPLKNRRKGETRIVLPISNELAEALHNYHQRQKMFLNQHHIVNSNNLICLNVHDYKYAMEGIPLNQRSLNQMLQKICKELGIVNGNQHLSFYSFRHTICTKLANTPNMSFPWVASRMGHSVEMFMRTYVEADRDRNQEMINKWMA